MMLITLAACIFICTFGTSSADRIGMITEGALAEYGQFPYIVSIRYKNEHVCAGSILDEEIILTSARCLKGFAEVSKSQREIQIVTGSNSLKDGDVYEVKSYKIHKDYFAMRLHHNIAYIKLKKPIVFYELVQPVKLRRSNIGFGRKCRLIGWGQSTYGATQDKLQYIDLKTIGTITIATRLTVRFARLLR